MRATRTNLVLTLLDGVIHETRCLGGSRFDWNATESKHVQATERSADEEHKTRVGLAITLIGKLECGVPVYPG